MKLSSLRHPVFTSISIAS